MGVLSNNAGLCLKGEVRLLTDTQVGAEAADGRKIRDETGSERN